MDALASSERARLSAWPSVLAIVGAVGVAVLAVAALVTAVPAVLANAGAHVSDGATPETLADGTASAQVVVPDGWIIIRADDASIIVRTPDDSVSARATVVAAPVQRAMQALVDAAPRGAQVGDVRTEVLGSGLPAAHADVTGAADDLFAVVTMGQAAGESPVVTVVVDVAAEHDPARYRPAVAQLLEGIRP